MKKYICALFAAFLGGCATAPKGVVPVTGFEIQRYLGTWHEVARLDHSFERGLSNVTAQYSMRDDGGVKVINRGYKAATGEWKEAEGRAYFTGESSVGQLKVSFFRPFYGGYNIVELDHEAYNYALVVGPSTKYMWILARQPDLAPEIVKRLLARAGELGFKTGDVIFPGTVPAPGGPGR